jgi:hypothetical protein
MFHCMKMNIVVAIGAIVLSGCTPRPTDTQVQLAAMQNAKRQVDLQSETCMSAVNADPEFVPLQRHLPANLANATLQQMTDPSYATPEEIQLLSRRRDRLLPCRNPFVAGNSRIVPAAGAEFASSYSKYDANLVPRHGRFDGLVVSG